MKTMKKAIALLLTMLLVISVSPIAFAQDENSEDTYEAEWFTSFGIKKGEGTLEQAVSLSGTGDRIVLLQDIEALNSTLYITKNTTIEGAGFTVTRSDTLAGEMFNIDSAATLKLEDVTINGNTANFPGYTAPIVNIVSGQLTLEEGAVLTENSARLSFGGAVVAGTEDPSTAKNCTIVMNEGSEISDCVGNIGGAVYMRNKTEMIMNGGVIKNCKAAYDGGAIVLSAGTSKLTVNKGEITGCSASLADTGCKGSAIYAPAGTVTLADAKITGNTNMSDLGAVYFTSAVNFTLGGNVYVYDNDGSATGSNIYVPENAVIVVSPEFTENAKIGVTAPSYFGETESIDISFINYSKDIMGYVYNDKDGTTFYNSNGVVSLIECIKVTFDPGNGTCPVSSKIYAVDLDFGELPECDPREGFEFLGWYTATDSLVTESTAVSYYEDITLYAKWENLNKLDDHPFAFIGRFFERIGDLLRMVFEFLENMFTGDGNSDLEELK